MIDFKIWILVLASVVVHAPHTLGQWEAVPWVTAEQRHAGLKGGEGCQMIMSLDCDATGRFVVMSTDVGGLYRSTDSGQNWSPTNIGYTPTGARCVQIDPHNPKIVLASGIGQATFDWTGMYRSTDGGQSWKPACLRPVNWGERAQIAFDPSTVANGGTQTVYWSPECFRDQDKGLYKSTDGGQNWILVNAEGGSSFLRVHPNKGWIYVGNSRGFFVSRDGGMTLTKVNDLPVRGVAVSAAAPDSVWVCYGYRLDRSDDGGKTWQTLPCTGLPTSGTNHTLGWFNLYASPADPQLLCLQFQTDGAMGWEKAPRYFSWDGGKSWSQPHYDYTGDFFPERIEGEAGRHIAIAFAARDKNVIYLNGVDYVMKSVDEGHSFRIVNSGYNGVMCFGRFNFNPRQPSLLFLGAQDYNAAISSDAGHTWKRLDASGQGTYGHIYSGYAFDERHIFAGVAKEWATPRQLRVSNDGGQTWTDTGLSTTGHPADTACPDPTNPDVAFWGEFRTADQGKTWSKLNGCEAVFTANGSQLYGASGAQIVVSSDHGITWKTVSTCPADKISDIAYDAKRQKLYVCGAWEQFWQYDGQQEKWTQLNPRLPVNAVGHTGVKTVCVDPADPSIVYAGNYDWYDPDASVIRSTDAGATWQRLTKTSPAQPGPDGGRMACCVRVDPQSRYLYVTTDCYGVWKYPPPARAK